jgi:hypothetical protein
MNELTLWAREMLGRVPDGEKVVLPASTLQYVVDHRQKLLTLDNVEELLDGDAFRAYIRGIMIFATAGYRVEDDALAAVAFEIHAHRMDCNLPTCTRESELLEMFFQGIAEQVEHKHQRERSGAN